MKLTISPAALRGTVTPPPSKSLAHRIILSAALADGESAIEQVELSEDIRATLRCIKSLGASWTLSGSTLHLTGMGAVPFTSFELPHFDCGESGSTLRFMIPIALALCGGGIFTGQGRLMSRPLEPYLDIFQEKGIHFEQTDHALIVQGSLKSGEYRLAGNVSSQFFTGLLFALSLLKSPSRIVSTTALESADYVAMTIEVLRFSGISIDATQTPSPCFSVQNGSYRPYSAAVEPDWSQAAFWHAAGEMGNAVTVLGMSQTSLQGDRIILDWLNKLRCGGEIVIDASQNPDLVPPLAARAVTMNGTLHIENIGRLRLKESDRISATADTLAALGADITAEENALFIRGKDRLNGGAALHCRGDHRIAMMLAIAATCCAEPITLSGAECVGKSYPRFWEDYKSLGGIVHEHIGE